MVRYKWTVLIITTIGVFMSSLDASIVNIAIPSLSRDLKTSFEVVQWIPIIYLLVQAVTLIGFGRISDLKGRKLFFLFGIFLFTFASFFSTFVTSGIILVIFAAFVFLTYPRYWKFLYISECTFYDNRHFSSRRDW